MNLKEKVEVYLEYCEFRKELDKKTLKLIGLIYVSILNLLHVWSLGKKK